MKILHLEDNPSDAHLVQLTLKRACVPFEYFFADSEADYLSCLENQEIDLILSDYHLPDYSGTEALSFANHNYPLIPFVFVSGTMGEDAAIGSLLSGATDYVLKNKLERLPSAVHRAFQEAQERKARVKAEKALQQSEENFHRSVAESPLGLRIVSVDGETIYANKTFLDIYEFCNLEEFTHTPAKDRYTPESFILHQERKAKRKDGLEVFEYEISIVRKNSEIRHVKVSRKEVLWNGIKHYQVINQDITEQKNLTIDLIAAKEKAEESDRLKTAFLHNVSHEIRTPMNAIVGFSGLLNEPALPPEKREKFTEIIVQSCNQLLSIISDIVTIATIEAGQEEVREAEMTLNATLRRVREQFLLQANKQNVLLELISPLPDDEDRILCDETKFVQIVTNLVGNALKFTKQGAVRFGYRIQDSALEFFVEDSGIGIPVEMQGEIFKRFRQVESTVAREFGGSGLGLSISKAYVELLGGKIWVTSELGKGSVFYFTLPFKRAGQPALSEKTLGREVRTGIKGTKTLLIAEDEDSNYLLLEILLSDLKFRIIRALNGAQAVDICKNQKIDIVLMDIKMPVMDGYEATRRIRTFLPNLPIIAQTAYSSEVDRHKALSSGCNDFISKPCKKDVLISKIENQLNTV